MNDELEQAMQAYRELHCADALNTQAIEQRIVASVGSRRRGLSYGRASRPRFSSVAVSATTFIFATAAYALTDDGQARLRFLVEWFTPASGRDAVAVSKAPAVPSAVAVPSAAAVSTASQPVPPPESVGNAEHAELAGPLPQDPALARGRNPALVPGPQVGAPSSKASVLARPSGEQSLGTSDSPQPEVKADDDAHRQLYRRAQRLADEGRHQEALALWDEYLAQYATEPLHVEARFNRIHNLIELKRYAEASVALLPFANGEFGRYRQEQARSLRRVLAR